VAARAAGTGVGDGTLTQGRARRHDAGRDQFRSDLETENNSVGVARDAVRPRPPLATATFEAGGTRRPTVSDGSKVDVSGRHHRRRAGRRGPWCGSRSRSRISFRRVAAVGAEESGGIRNLFLWSSPTLQREIALLRSDCRDMMHGRDESSSVNFLPAAWGGRGVWLKFRRSDSPVIRRPSRCLEDLPAFVTLAPRPTFACSDPEWTVLSGAAESLYWPQRRRAAMVYLANQTGARLCGTSMVADDGGGERRRCMKLAGPISDGKSRQTRRCGRSRVRVAARLDQLNSGRRAGRTARSPRNFQRC